MTEPVDGGAAEETPDAQDSAGIDLTIVTGDPDDTELAAIAAVLTAMTDELSAAGRSAPSKAVSAWSRSQRAIRQPLHPGAGVWRGFSGR